MLVIYNKLCCTQQLSWLRLKVKDQDPAWSAQSMHVCDYSSILFKFHSNFDVFFTVTEAIP